MLICNPAPRAAPPRYPNILTLQNGKHTTFKVISGLKPGTYTFRVAAVNEAGEGEPATTNAVTIR